MDTKVDSAFFDDFESKYGDYDVLGELAYARLLKRFVAEIQPQPGQRCFDLGCGTGAFTRRLTKFQLQLTGMDISSRCVALANKQATTENYTVGNIMDTGLPEQCADIVVYSCVLHHIDKKEERVRVLKEGLRLLKPGGRLFAFDPNRHSPSMWLYRSPQSPFFSQEGKTELEVLLADSDLIPEITSAGFRDVRAYGLGGITYRFVEGKTARAMLPLYNLYERLMMICPFQKRLGTMILSLARKP